MALAYAASVVMFYVFARYRYPLVPFLMLFAAQPVAFDGARVRGAPFRSGFATAAARRGDSRVAIGSRTGRCSRRR